MLYAARVAALEDKIVQKATVAVLNAIYEEDFLGFSYGFRPKRSQHDALDALMVGISSTKVNYILDCDLRTFFNSVSQDWLVRFLNHRIGDPRIIRLIQKWLKAGVLEEGVVSVSETGTGQGSVISPLLANIYLHYAFDLWAKRWRQREATGDLAIYQFCRKAVDVRNWCVIQGFRPWRTLETHDERHQGNCGQHQFGTQASAAEPA